MASLLALVQPFTVEKPAGSLRTQGRPKDGWFTWMPEQPMARWLEENNTNGRYHM